MKPQDMKILAIGDRCWGKGNSVDEAIKNMRQHAPPEARNRYILYVCHPDTRVCEDGALAFPHDIPPKEIQRKGVKKS